MKREPLYPHIPKRREPLHPHQPKSHSMPVTKLAKKARDYWDEHQDDTIPGVIELYHGTPKSNLEVILREGIKPRTWEQCEALIDDWLTEYGYTRTDVPKWVWRYPLGRCQETTEAVFLTGNKEYALGNSQAGYEAETSFRQGIASWRKGERLTAEERWAITKRVHEPYSALIKVRIPTRSIHRLEDLEDRVPLVMRHYPRMSERQAWEYILTETTITVDRVLPEFIISYEVVEYRRNGGLLPGTSHPTCEEWLDNSPVTVPEY